MPPPLGSRKLVEGSCVRKSQLIAGAALITTSTITSASAAIANTAANVDSTIITVVDRLAPAVARAAA